MMRSGTRRSEEIFAGDGRAGITGTGQVAADYRTARVGLR